MHAMRLARAYTGRTKIVKFEGQYHGVHDYALISVTPSTMEGLGDRDNPVGLAWGRGIPQAIAETIIPAPFNDLDFLRRLFERRGEIASASSNRARQCRDPAPHRLPRWFRALTQEFGILLHTTRSRPASRFARGGPRVLRCHARYRDCQAMGNGYPVAAFGAIMAMLPDKMAWRHLRGHRVALRAPRQALRLASPGDHQRAGKRIQTERAGSSRPGLPFVFTAIRPYWHHISTGCHSDAIGEERPDSRRGRGRLQIQGVMPNPTGELFRAKPTQQASISTASWRSRHPSMRRSMGASRIERRRIGKLALRSARRLTRPTPRSGTSPDASPSRGRSSFGPGAG